jgi:curved DNA-binding protein CbpA
VTTEPSGETVMHDLFEILGLPTNAPARDVRRACRRRPRRVHPDFHDSAPVGLEERAPDDDLAIDFVDASTFNDRIQAAFFEKGSGGGF